MGERTQNHVSFQYRYHTDTIELVEQFAEQFTGLPPDVGRFEIIKALKHIGVKLGFRQAHIRYLELMLSYTKERDWREDACHPFVYLSVKSIAEKLGISRQHVNRIENALVELHAITLRDSGNYHRRGKRTKSGAFVTGYGVDLRPLGVLWTKISDEWERYKQEEREWREVKRAVSSLRTRIRDILNSGSEGLQEDDQELFYAEPMQFRIRASTALEKLKEIYSFLQKLFTDLTNKVLKKFDENDHQNNLVDAEMLHECRQNVTHYRLLNTDSSSIKKVVGGLEQEEERCLPEQSNPQDARYQRQEEKETVPIRLSDVIRAMPPLLTSYLRDGERSSWRDVIEACYLILPALGVSKGLWQRLCDRLGPQQASMCVVITATRFVHGEVRYPGGFLMGMLRKMDKGELNIASSLHGLIARSRSPITMQDEQKRLASLASIKKPSYQAKKFGNLSSIASLYGLVERAMKEEA